jgi:hypothetical protein
MDFADQESTFWTRMTRVTTISADQNLIAPLAQLPFNPR